MVVFQLTVVDRIAFPGGSGPNLVLLAVAALALASGPMAGALTGFWAGLALDVAPPGSHFVGQDALVFCLIGYACGLLADDSSGDGATEPGHTALFEIMVTAAGAICGEALGALLGVMLSDPRVTWPAITAVLPAAVAYDVLLCPFVLYAVAAALRLAGARREGRRAGWSPARSGAPVPGAAGLRGPGGSGRPMARREPQLKLGRGSSLAFGGSARAGLGSARAGLGPARAGHGPAFGAGGRGGGPAKVRFASSSMGRSWLGGSVFSRSTPSGALGSAFGRSAPLGRSSPFRHRGNLMRSPGGLGGRAPRFSRPSALARLACAVGPARVGPARVGPARVGPARVGPAQVPGQRLAACPVRPPYLAGARLGERAPAPAAIRALRPVGSGPVADAPAAGQEPLADGPQEMADRRLPVNTASRRRLLVLYVLAAAMLVSLGGPALLPAGDQHHRLHQAGRREPDQERDRAGGPRPDPRRCGQPAGDQSDGAGRLGGHDEPVPAAGRRRAGAARARPAARPVLSGAGGQDAAVHGRRPAALLGRLALPAHPGGPERLRPGGAAGDGGAEGVPWGIRAGPAGHRLPAAGRGQSGPGARLPAADHPPGDRQPAPARDRLLRRGPGRPGRPGGAVRQPAPRPGRHPGRVGQRRRRCHRHRGPDPARQRRRPRDEPQLADTGRRPERAQRRDRPVAGLGQRRQPGRGGRDDDHRPGGGDGQLPGLQPQRVDRRHLPAGVQRPVRSQRRGAGRQLDHPGPVPARLYLQGHLDRRRGGRRVPAERPVQLPGVGQHRQSDLRQRRRAQPRRDDVRRSADPVLRHRVLQPRLRHVPQ